MLFNYTPEGAEKRQWVFAPDKLMSSEAEAIEKVTGLTYQEFGGALVKGSVTARRALLWVLLKRTEPTLRHSQVDFPSGAVTLEYEQHELVAMRDLLALDPDLSDPDRVMALNQMDELITEAEAAAPKAPASADASSD